jgi:hypothetical protein
MRQQLSIREHFWRGNAPSHPDCRATLGDLVGFVFPRLVAPSDPAGQPGEGLENAYHGRTTVTSAMARVIPV